MRESMWRWGLEHKKKAWERADIYIYICNEGKEGSEKKKEMERESA